MKYHVVWKPAALGQLAALWTSATERGAITAAADAIDWMLATDPQKQGESRSGQVRILVHAPLAVYFSVSEQDQTVGVYAVWRWGPIG